MAVKIKINNLAKDLNLKSKEIIPYLEKCGVTGKTISASLENNELSAIFNYLTKENQISNIDDYVDGKVVIQKVIVETKDSEKPKVETNEIGQPVKENTKEQGKPETVNATKIEDKKDEITSNQGTHNQKPFNSQSENTSKKPETKVIDKNNTQKPSQNNQNQPKQNIIKNDKKPDGKQGVQTAQPKKMPNSFNTERGASKNSDRFTRPVQQTNKKEQKPLQKDDNRQNVKKTIMQGGGEQVTAVKKTRVIDTHAGSFDTSKYEYDKYDVYSNDNKRFANDNNKQKLKKQNNYSDSKQRKEQEKKFLDKKNKNQKEKIKQQPLKISIPDEIVVSELASLLKVNVTVVITKLMSLSVMANINQTIDFETAALVAEDLGAIVTKQVVVTIEDKLFEEEDTDVENLRERDPVVCVMGHVDHGKTSLLDAIRNTHVTTSEAGGITQSIGAYRVKLDDKYITFLDTPGHEAFGAMRARGAQATDIAILVVAADDGIMPQTVEAINYAKAAGVSIIVAINKMDKPGAKPDEIKQALMKYDLIPEEWGGDVMCVNVSALKRTGLDELLEDVLLVAEFKELKANPTKRAKGVVIEASLKKGLGPCASVLVQNGTLHQGDIVIAGTTVGRVRIMQDENGKSIKEAGPSVPALIVGLDDVPLAGDEFNAVEDEKMARTLAEQRKVEEKKNEFDEVQKKNMSLDDLFNQIQSGVKELNIVIKADVRGSAEAVKNSLEKLSNEEVKVNVLSTGVGGITESDVKLAAASNAIIIGFNVRPDKLALDASESEKIEIRTYRIIYECIEEIKSAIKGMLKPVYHEVILGHAIVRQTIRVPNVGTIAGAYVQDGKITRSAMVRIVRDGVVIFEDSIGSLKRFKDDVKEVLTSFECGIGLSKFNDIRENDILEVYTNEEVTD